MNDIIIVYLLFCGIVFLVGCAMFHHYTEEIPIHKWDDTMEDFTKRAPVKEWEGEE